MDILGWPGNKDTCTRLFDDCKIGVAGVKRDPNANQVSMETIWFEI
jgi:hypothetical protein